MQNIDASQQNILMLAPYLFSSIKQYSIIYKLKGKDQVDAVELVELSKMSGVKASQICFDADISPSSLLELIIQNKKKITVNQVNEILNKKKGQKQAKQLKKQIGQNQNSDLRRVSSNQSKDQFKFFPIGYKSNTN